MTDEFLQSATPENLAAFRVLQQQITQQEAVVQSLERDGLDASAARELLLELQEHLASAVLERERASEAARKGVGSSD